MKKLVLNYQLYALLCISFFSTQLVSSQIIISQYYEGTGTNKWIELTNTSNVAINTASPQLKLGLWAVTGSTGNIAFAGAPSSTVNLSVIIPAYGSVLIGNTGNGTEISYLSAASAAQTSNTVINFNGNDGVALLDANNVILDQFGTGINAVDISYVRNTTVTATSATYVPSQWTSATIAAVQTATSTSATRLNYQLSNSCIAPINQPTAMTFSSVSSAAISGSFTASAADEYLVVCSTAATLSTLPSNGSSYTIGSSIGNATVVGTGNNTSFTANGLSPTTTYYFYAFAVNSLGCNGGPAYQTTAPLTNNVSTTASPCNVPSNAPSALIFGTPSSTSISGSFTATTADQYLLLYSTSASLSQLPLNGTSYSVGSTLGNAIVGSNNTSTAFSVSGLTPSTTYYCYVFAYNSLNCSGGPIYQTISPLTGSSTTLAPPCVAPSNQPSALVFNNSTSSSLTGSFTATTADEYLVLVSTSATLSSNPINGTVYVSGNTIGNASVVSKGTSLSFITNGLNANTTYYYTVFAIASTNCSGGPLYLTTAPLSGSSTTLPTPCIVPTNQPTTMVFGNPTSTTISGSFTGNGANEYLVVYCTASLSASPINGTVYNTGMTLGNGIVVTRSSATTFSISGLSSSTTYYVTVFALNSLNCSGGPIYQTVAPLIGTNTTLATPCVAPSNQPSALIISNTTSSTVTASFTATIANEYLVVYSTASTLTALPVNGTVYNAGATFGIAKVASRGTSTTFVTSGLLPSTVYYFYVFALNSTSCSGGPIYKTTTPLAGTATTTEAPLYYYFGNFHSHSEYSDGTGLPSGDFAYGDTANCMDFLGISEHNHVSAGMSLNNWILGRQQATAATTPNFLALYGMEWGVISGGGHVVVYGVNQLLGWDAGQYQRYVPQSVYTGTTGLFNVINSYGSTAFATLAHPNNADYNGIMSTYDTVSDDAIVGTAVENGPSTSTNTTYSDFPASMTYLSYYRNMLARGYHLGPTIDHDNHNVTHGHTVTSRTVVLSTSLAENDVLTAMRLMRFYASQDCGAYVTFKVNNKPLGTIMTAAGTPVITVTTSTSSPVTSLKIYSGVAGSGTNATILTSTTSGSITYTHTALTNLSSRYYYIDITEADGKRIITAPIWFTRNDAARKESNVAIAEFYTITEPKNLILKWITTNERNNQNFTIEKSYDGINYETMEVLAGRGASLFPQNYTVVDTSSQNEGVVYYQLTQRDAEGTIVFADIKKVTRTIAPQFLISIYPNPVVGDVQLKIENARGEDTLLQVYAMTGQLVYEQKITTIIGDQDLQMPFQNLTQGVYMVTLKSGDYTSTTKITKL